MVWSSSRKSRKNWAPLQYANESKINLPLTFRSVKHNLYISNKYQNRETN